MSITQNYTQFVVVLSTYELSKNVNYFQIQLTCNYSPIHAAEDGSYHPDSRGKYTPDGKGQYVPDNSGQYKPDGKGKYVPDNRGSYVPQSN